MGYIVVKNKIIIGNILFKVDSGGEIFFVNFKIFNVEDDVVLVFCFICLGNIY